MASTVSNTITLTPGAGNGGLGSVNLGYPPGSTVGGNTYTISGNGAGSSSTILGATIPSGTGLSYSTVSTGWQAPNTNFNAGGKTVMSIPADGNSVVLEPSATLDVKGNIVMNGVDLEERLRTIEKILTIPERDAIMEAKHPKLKKMYDEYIAALGKYRTFEKLKGEDDAT